MNLIDLEESYLLSLNQDAQNLFIEFRVLLNSTTILKVFAHNKDTSPIKVNFIGLNIRSGFNTSEGIPCIGEIEAIAESESGFSFEGDMGYIQVVADTWFVESVK